LLQILCSNCVACEKEIIKKFKIKYIHRKDIGRKYFEGDHTMMMEDIFSLAIFYHNFSVLQENANNVRIFEGGSNGVQKNLSDKKEENN